jgi:hypothetical protein
MDNLTEYERKVLDKKAGLTIQGTITKALSLEMKEDSTLENEKTTNSTKDDEK